MVLVPLSQVAFASKRTVAITPPPAHPKGTLKVPVVDAMLGCERCWVDTVSPPELFLPGVIQDPASLCGSRDVVERLSGQSGLRGLPPSYVGGSMQNAGYRLPRFHLLGTWMNKTRRFEAVPTGNKCVVATGREDVTAMEVNSRCLR